MAEDWLTDVRRYDSNADEGVVAGIVRYCGIALRNRDSSLVSFGDPKETARVRENYLRKKLALTEDDATLDQAIARVGERMQGDRTKNRVTVYYLLADQFGRLDRFAVGKSKAAASVAPVVPAAAVASAAPVAAMSPASSGAAPPRVAAAPADAGSDPGAYVERQDGFIGFGLGVVALVIGLALFAMVAGRVIAHGTDEPASAPTSPASPADFSHPLPVTAPNGPAGAPAAVPQGAGVAAATRDAKPMLSVYFDTGKADVTPQFAATAAPLLGYLSANPQAKASISGFNDPSGYAALNAQLSKQRAQNVQAALVAAGVNAARTVLVKPADTTTTNVTAEEARRVEVTVAG